MKSAPISFLKKTPFFLLLVVLISAGCKKEEDMPEPAPVENEIRISEKAVIIENEEDVIQVDSATVEIVNSVMADTLELGDVIVSGVNSTFPSGFFGKVISIKAIGGGVEVETEPASLVDVIENCSIRFKESFTPDDTMRTNIFNLNFDVALYDADGNLATDDDQVKLEGEISTDLDLIFELDIENFQMTYFRAGFISNDNAEIGISSTVDNAFFDYDKALYSYNFAPINIQVGLFPITIFPALVFRGGGKGEVEAEISFTSERTALFQGAIKYSNGNWAKDNINATYYELIDANVQGGVSGEAYLRAGLEFYLYNHKNIKSSIYLKPKIEAEAECNTNTFECNYSLSAGLELAANVKVEIFDRSLINYTNTFLDESKVFAEGTTSPEFGTFTDDRDGQEYGWTQIGDQIWMSENLKFETQNSLCFEDEQANCEDYGALYNQTDLASACPSGWKAPSIEDYLELVDYLGGENEANIKLRSQEFGGNDEVGFNLKASPFAQYDIIGGPHYNYSYSDQVSFLMTSSENATFGKPIVIVFSPDGLEYMSYGNNGLFTFDEKTTCRCIKE